HQCRGAELQKRTDVLLSLVGRTGMANDKGGQRQARSVRRMDQAGEYGEVIGSSRGEFTIKAQGILRGRQGMRHEAAQHLSQRMEPDLKGGRHSKVPTASAQGPEEIWVLLRGHGGYVSGGGHQFDRQ